MARKRDERTLRMMRNYIEHHNEGMSILDIAALYKISPKTVYYSLDDIALENHVTRDSLLYFPDRKCSGGTANGGYEAFRPYDLIRELFDEAEKAADELSSHIRNSLSA